KCPCSQATVAELEQLLAAFHARHPDSALELCVVATIPRTAEDSWAQTRLIQRSLRLADAKLILDRGGVEASRFGAQISGTVLLFDAAGRQRYAGGVTASRGQEGENAGSAALARLLAGEAPNTNPTLPAFGCRLVLEASRTVNEVAGPGAVEACCDEAGCAPTRPGQVSTGGKGR
ncbi:MAG TPA: hypothetical protein VMG10_01200, partial [Gemmataceae bacterium]|nr:hypothetical protein [Gemmataceae bacterium]